MVAILVLIGIMIVAPTELPQEVMTNTEALMQSRPFHVALAVAFLFTEMLVIGFSWLILRLVVGRDWTRLTALRRPGGAHLLFSLAAAPALILLANGAYEVLRRIVHVPSISDAGVPGMEQMVGVFQGWPWPFAVLVIGLGPGIGEELWCRGFLGRGLVGRYGPILGVVFASFFFGLIHLDPCQGSMALLMGLFLHFVYLTSRSLWLPMLLHFLNNSFAVVASRFDTLKVVDANPATVPLFVYGAAGILMACVAWALYESRARLQTIPGSGFSWQPPYPGVQYPPPGADTKVVHPWPSLTATAVAVGGFVLFLVSFWVGVVAG
jgi:membrane protease YdiL (CAAX protease family)